MKHTFQYILTLLILVSCQSSGEVTVSSPDKKLRISFVEQEGLWPHPRVIEWTNRIRFKAEGHWQADSSQSLSLNYYVEEPKFKHYYEELQRDDYTEWETGFRPIRIDQLTLSNGMQVYLVYALTYADAAYHDYYYSYTALCIKDGRIWRYPIFKELMDSEDIKSDILILNPASIDLDFTTHPSYYDYGLDYKIIEADIDDRIAYDLQTGELIIADSLYLQFDNDSFMMSD